MNETPIDGAPEGRGRAGEGECARIRDLLPLAVAGRLSGDEATEVRRHLGGCDDCRSEKAFLLRVLEARTEAPGELSASVLERFAAAPTERRRGRSPNWGLPAAAVVVLALGVGVLWERSRPPETVWSLALDPVAEPWGQEEWMVAGTAVLDEVSEETLLALLEEMDG